MTRVVDRRSRASARAGRVFLSALSLWLFLIYLIVVLPVDNFLPVIDQWRYAVVLAFLFLIATVYVVNRIDSRAPVRLTNIAVLSLTSLVCLLAVDVASSAYFNLNDFSQNIDGKVDSAMDEHLWYGELMPRQYYPTEANFDVYKPLQKRSGFTYGEQYYKGLLDHAVFRDILKPAEIEFTIDKYGLRNVDPPEQSEIFALGDSFVFGYDVTQSALFEELLKQKLGQPIYNMGVHGSSPGQQLLLLKHFLNTYPESFRPRRLLWILYEGNDLEEDYSPMAPPSGSSAGLGRVFRTTLVEHMFQLPRIIRQQSVLNRIARGGVVFKPAVSGSQKSDHYMLDGARLAFPLYHSERFGYVLFRPEYLERMSQPESYVLDHPNRPLLEETFQRMRDLSRERGFSVTVVIVPTRVRLYKDAFEDLPPISEQPHFINYLKKLSDSVGFRRLDFNELMAPYAAKELLYQRDDTHWNRRGHEVAAELLAQYAIK